jgi:hypothetical protein
MEKQLFTYQREELMAEQAVRDAHKAELKAAKLLWKDSLTVPKKQVKYKTIIKSNADELWAGFEKCAQFCN